MNTKITRFPIFSNPHTHLFSFRKISQNFFFRHQVQYQHTAQVRNKRKIIVSTTKKMAFAASALILPRVILPHSRCRSALPYLSPRTTTSYLSSSSINNLSESRRYTQLRTRATSADDTSSSTDAGEVFADLKEKWDAIEDKSTVLLYGGGAIVAVWLSSIVVGAINSVPLLPKFMELVGLGYTGWFVYRYLLFKTSRKELVTDIESLKKKIAGTE